jgi:hypothetical protein
MSEIKLRSKYVREGRQGIRPCAEEYERIWLGKKIGV